MVVQGSIVKYDGETLYIKASFWDVDFMQRKNPRQCAVRIDDGRTVTNSQRRKIFAMVSDIGDFTSRISNNREYTEMLRELQLLYVIDKTDNEAIRRQLTMKYCELAGRDVFSLSSVDVTTARDFIDWLVELCLRHDIPCNDTLLNRCEDIGRYLYHCVALRKCCICGGKADIHEVDKVGMGGNRVKMHHVGQRVQPLCREHHTEEEALGQARFNRKYHLQDIRLDGYLCRMIGWRE